VHIRLLTALARQAERTVLTLTRAPEAAGRRFRRFEQTRERLLRRGLDAKGNQLWREATVGAIHELPQPTEESVTRPPALDHLVESVFLGQPDSLPVDGAVSLIEAPDVWREVRATLRRVKRLLLDGESPDSIAIIARDLPPYSAALRETARAYGVPLVVRELIPLRDSPVIALLLQLIDLAALDFPRRELLDTLRSPYLDPPDLTANQIAQMERVSMARRVVRGRAVWLESIVDAARAWDDEDGERIEGLSPTDAAALRNALARHFDRLTPPAHGTGYTLTSWIERLIGPDPEAAALDAAEAEVAAGDDEPGDDAIPVGDSADHAEPGAAAGEARNHFDVVACARAASDAGRVARDVRALGVFTRVLRGLRAAHDLLAEDRSPTEIAWPDFRAELQLAVDHARVVPPGGLSRLGRALAMDALEARGLPHDHIFILGLSEGVFPAQEPEGKLYQESERQSLEQAGIDMLTAVERADDMSLFYQIVGLARRSLTLSRFTIDDRGALCPPSPYWSAIRAAVDIPETEIDRIRVGAAPTLDESATLSEAAVAVAAAWSSEHDADPLAAASVHNALLDQPGWAERWRNALRGRALEARRENPVRPFDRHSGALADADLIALVARWLGPDHIWSASQFNEYGACPFRFFARRVLRLEEQREPEEGLDAMQFGSVNHAILERAYRRIADEGLSIAPENRTRALRLLNDTADEVFVNAPEVYGFRASPLWRQEQVDTRTRLRWLVERDFGDDTPLRLQPRQSPRAHPVAAWIGDSDRQPYWQEAAFGLGDAPPLEIDGPAGPVRARGVIDRLDRAGDHLVVIDYKTGSATRSVQDMAEGHDFQMMLYLLAAREWTRADPALRVAGGLFWHIRNRAVSGEVLADDPAVDEARARLHENILAARRGWFTVQPGRVAGGQCASQCEFSALCRFNRAHPRKPAQKSI
jgi:ATP-dependent helicase/DNAse subunit B